MGDQPSHPPPSPSDYPATCHRLLASSTLSPSRTGLRVRVNPGPGYSHWRSVLAVLPAHSKFLLMPAQFIDAEAERREEESWCQESPSIEGLLVEYELYIYTLANEITARRVTQGRFREEELWKVLRCGAGAIMQWLRAYPGHITGIVMPDNFVISTQGQIRLVHRHSFIEQLPHNEESHQFYPPQPIHPNQPHSQTPASVMIYGLGATLMEMALVGSPWDGFKQAGVSRLAQISWYGYEIKDAIAGMVAQGGSRLGVGEVVARFQKYKEYHHGRQVE